MTTRARIWPSATGQLRQTRTVIMCNDEDHCAELAAGLRADSIVVMTPLDLIAALEDRQNLILTIVLAGGYAKNRDLISFLYGSYPTVRVVDGGRDAIPDTYLPMYA